LTKSTKRFRLFAGPNGSGKSTMIAEVRKHKSAQTKLHIDFGIYINADDIAKKLQANQFSCKSYAISFNREHFMAFAMQSGLIQTPFTKARFESSFLQQGEKLILKEPRWNEHLAQLLAAYLTQTLLVAGKKISLETVFSHPGKIDLIRMSNQLGYKVYLYYICTESPDINVYRIKNVRIKQHGHDVPEEKIRSRYYRSLNLLHQASQYCYQAFYFDNSGETKPFQPFAHFKKQRGKKIWDAMNNELVPNWFIKYYSNKIQ